VQARLLRDIFGPLPFRSVGVASHRLTLEVVALAQRASPVKVSGSGFSFGKNPCG
jgi:hypothetical protein